MAPRTGHLGGLVAVVALVVAVAGCGGGSSASGTAATAAATTTATSATTATKTPPAPAQSKPDGQSPEADASKGTGSKDASEGSASKGQGSQDPKGGGKTAKKNPPLSLPEGPPEPAPTKAQKEKVPSAVIKLSVPSAPAGNAPGVLPATYTCDGKNISPEVTWGKLPAGVAEVALFVMNLQPVNEKLYFDYAIAGISPSQERLRPDEVPKGAVIGRNSAGKDEYSLCPPGSASEEFIFAIYPVTKKMSPKQGFEPLALRQKATPLTHSNGLFAVSYPKE